MKLSNTEERILDTLANFIKAELELERIDKEPVTSLEDPAKRAFALNSRDLYGEQFIQALRDYKDHYHSSVGPLHMPVRGRYGTGEQDEFS